MKEIRERDEPRHPGAIVETVASPKRRNGVTEAHCLRASRNARSVRIVAVKTGACIDELAMFGVRRAIEFGHSARAVTWNLLALYDTR
jgi:hypothetical protein